MAEFPLRASGGTPVGVTEDPKGNVWTLLANGNIVELDDSGRLLAQYPVPTYNGLAGAPAGSGLGLITYDATDGNIWFYEASGNRFGRLNPASGATAEFPLLPFSSDPGIDQIVAGPDGNIYFTEPTLNEIGMLDIKTDLVSQFTMPLADTQPQGITVGGDGNLWFTEGGQNKIASLDPISHVITNYPFEPPSHITNDLAEGITAGPNDTLWFVERQNNMILKFDIASGTFGSPILPVAPQNPTPAQLWSIAEGPDGKIYYTEPGLSQVGCLDPATGNQVAVVQPRNVQNPPPVPNLTNALIANAVQGKGQFLFVSVPSSGALYNINITTDNTQNPPVDYYGVTPTPPPIPTTDANDVVSASGKLYFTDSIDGVGQVGVFDPTTLTSAVYQVPQLPPIPQTGVRNQDPNQMTVDSDGNIWFTETTALGTGAIGEFIPSSGTFGAQSYLTSSSSQPVGIAWDAIEKLIWITEPGANQIVSYNPATTGSAVAPVALSDPVGVLVDPATGYLWITEGSSNQIVNYDPINQKILYSFSTKASPDQLIWGPDGNIWFTEPGFMGVLTPPTGPGTGSIKTEIPVTGSPTDLAVGPSEPSGPSYTKTIWFTESGSNQIGEIDTTNDTFVGFVTAPDTNANAIATGPDGNMWFTSGQVTPAWMGAVVLNPNDLGASVDVTTQPPDVEQTTFGGFDYGFGLVVSVENNAGQVDPFMQQGTITISLRNNPGGAKLNGSPNPITVPLNDGVAVFDGLTMDVPASGYVIQAVYTFNGSPTLNTATTDPFYVSGPPARLVVTTQPPASVTAGKPFGVTIAAEDASGRIIPGFDDAIALAILKNPPGDGALNGADTLGALYGTAGFSGLSIDQAGVGYTLQATDITPSPYVGAPMPAAGSTAPFNVTAGPATQLVYKHEPPGSATAGQNLAAPRAIVIDAEDKYGNLDTTYKGTVTISLANGATGKLVGTLTVDAVAGVATFSNLAIQTDGTYRLGAQSGSLPQATSTSITINSAAPARLVWAAQAPAQLTQGSPFGATIDVQDQYGNPEPTYNGNVAITLDLNGKAASADLGGTTTIAASGGVATFSNLIINALGNPFTLIATSGALTSPASSAIDVVLAKLVVSSQSLPATAGAGFTITVTAETYLGTVDSAFAGTVGLSIQKGPGAGAQLGTATASNGVATFNNVVLDAASASYVLQATSGNLVPGTIDVTVVPAAADALSIVQQPSSSVQAGTGFGLEVGAVDKFGNTTDLTGSVKVAIQQNPGGSTLGGTATVTASGGVASFSGLTLNKVSTGYTLVVTSGSLTSATTTGIAVTPGAAAQLAIPSAGEPPASVTAGQAFTLVVDAEDQFGNLVPSFTGSLTIAQPSGVTGTTTVAASKGVATFSNLVIDKAGTYKLQATSSGLSPATSSSFTIVAGTTPAQLTWATEPPGQVAHGAPFGGAVDVEDPFGNLETGFSGNTTVALKSNLGNATLGGTVTVAASGGVATFSGLTINVIDNGYTLVATAGGKSTPASTAIDVTAVGAASLKLTTAPPTSVQAAQSFGLAVTALDSSGNPDPDFNGSVTVSISSPSGSTALGGKVTVTASAGVASFSGLTLGAVGTYTLQISSGTLSPARTGNIDVTPGSATQLVVTSQPPGSVTAGTAFGVQVEAEDRFGNLATNFDGTLTAALSANAGGATLSGQLTAQASGGIASFSGLAVDEAGRGYTIHLTSTGLSAATTGAFDVTPAAASQLLVTKPPPASLTAGSSFGLTVAITDPFGNVVASPAGTVAIALASGPAGAALNGGLSATTSNGLATFSGLALDTAGSGYTIQATSSGLAPATTSFAVVAAAPTRLIVSIPPPTIMTAGADFGLAISAEDAYGNLATGFTGAITLALAKNPGGASLIGSPLVVAANGGTSNFGPSLSIQKAGSGYTLTATSGGLTPVTTGAITVVPGAPTHLAVVAQPPSSVKSGSPFGLTVAAEDAYGNVNPNFSGSVVVAAPTGSGVTLGGVTAVGTSQGLGSLNGLALTGANATVSLQITSPGLTGATTAPISLGGSTTGGGGGSGGTTTPTGTPSSAPPLVTMGGIQVVRNKRRRVTEIIIGFPGGLNPAVASSTAEYQLIVAGRRRSFTARNAKSIKLRSDAYNATNQTVTLTPKRRFVIKKPVEFIADGQPPSGLLDSSGRLIDGNHDGNPGGSAVAVLRRHRKNVTVQPLAVTAATVDVLPEQADLIAPPRRGL